MIVNILFRFNLLLCALFGHKHSEWFDVHMVWGDSGFVRRQMRFCRRCPYGEEFRDKPDSKIGGIND